jgi:hypothetical protein
MLLPVASCSRRLMTPIAGLSLLSAVRAGCGCMGGNCSDDCGTGTYLTGKSNSIGLDVTAERCARRYRRRVPPDIPRPTPPLPHDITDISAH